MSSCIAANGSTAGSMSTIASRVCRYIDERAQSSEKERTLTGFVVVDDNVPVVLGIATVGATSAA